MPDRQRRERSAGLAVYVISVVADLAGVHPQTLRMYERKGLIEPQRTAGNSRRYSQLDVDRLKRIQELTQDGGVNLAGVRIIMELEHRLERANSALSRSQTLIERMQDRMDALEDELDAAEDVIRASRRSRGVLVRMSDVRDLFAADRGRDQG
ncbi:MAG: heat shock protein transcriptional repressor HspR [Actinomycetota bacterium]